MRDLLDDDHAVGSEEAEKSFFWSGLVRIAPDWAELARLVRARARRTGADKKIWDRKIGEELAGRFMAGRLARGRGDGGEGGLMD